jgi:hypothetical protein
MAIKTLKYEAHWVCSTVTLQEDGSVREVGGWRCEIGKGRTNVAVGTVFPSVRAWVETLNAEVMVRCPWVKNRAEKLKAVDVASSVVWVESAEHYMEVRRGDKTKFTKGERRTWTTVDEWIASLTPPPAVPVKEEEEAPAPVLVVEAVVLAAPAVKAFNVEKFRETWAQLRDLTRKETGTLRSTHVIQLCQFLLDTRPAAAEWLVENPVWRYTVRAIVQELGWSAGHQGAHDAVAAFLEKF